MKYRRLTNDWDWQMGHALADYLIDSPQTVEQAVLTRLKLFVGEWFNDTAEGTPWATDVLGKHTRTKYDPAIRRRILGTQGVTGITEYRSSYDGETRTLTISATVETIYGMVVMQGVL